MSAGSSKQTEGKIDFVYDGETFQTYYKLFGDLQNRTGDPLIVLHGGPGLCHDYLISFADLSPQYGIPVILYDQLGNGKSTHLREKPPTFWTFDLFIDELVNLLNSFSIQEGFNLVGHSWGGVLALEFIVRRRPAGLKRLILSNTLASAELWQQSTQQLMQAFPRDVQEGLMAGMSQPDKFYSALKKFHLVHGCASRPVPEVYWKAMEQVFGPEGDPTVAGSPIMQNWSIVDRLHLVNISTLVINGCRDIAQDFVIQPFLEKIPNVRRETFEHFSHSPFIEEKEEYMRVVAEFLLSQ
ncbi:proline-specific peptidase [Gymnopilus junonius]|uniref:Proline-specific peptidase n=1 Tax=Gymnopilus junonius TaxID=109634 RepID=A0A9P5TM25_GYMJU|nr:proline-specific peptidase [Gymnopilus junonius]